MKDARDAIRYKHLERLREDVELAEKAMDRMREDECAPWFFLKGLELSSWGVLRVAEEERWDLARATADYVVEDVIDGFGHFVEVCEKEIRRT